MPRRRTMPGADTILKSARGTLAKELKTNSFGFRLSVEAEAYETENGKLNVPPSTHYNITATHRDIPNWSTSVGGNDVETLLDISVKEYLVPRCKLVLASTEPVA